MLPSHGRTRGAFSGGRTLLCCTRWVKIVAIPAAPHQRGGGKHQHPHGPVHSCLHWLATNDASNATPTPTSPMPTFLLSRSLGPTQDCCAACVANPKCHAISFGPLPAFKCRLKKGPGTPEPFKGRLSCVVRGATPPAPAPPPVREVHVVSSNHFDG